jgi:hypothetical protein
VPNSCARRCPRFERAAAKAGRTAVGDCASAEQAEAVGSYTFNDLSRKDLAQLDVMLHRLLDGLVKVASWR